MFFFYYDEETNTTAQVPVENTGTFDEQELEFFYNDRIRKVWHKQEEEWYFSIVDVCQVLTDSTDATTYWRKLKQRLKKEGNQTVTNCHGLKLLHKENLRDNMTNIELALNQLAEVSATAISQAKNPKGYLQTKETVLEGGSIAGNARKELEERIGRSVISPANAVDPQLLDDSEK